MRLKNRYKHKFVKLFQIIWFGSILSFFGTLSLVAESAGTRNIEDPGHQKLLNYWFVSIGIGIISFLLYSALRIRSAKNKDKAFVRIFIQGFAGLLLCVSGFIGILISSGSVNLDSQENPNNMAIVQGAPQFTGQELFDAVNKYRAEHGVAELKLSQDLCNNLAQRYFDIKAGIEEGVAHKNFEDWVEDNVPQGYHVSEDFAYGQTPAELLKAWEGSPGHRLSILDSRYKVGCSYAHEGYGVIELGYKVSSGQSSTNTGYTGDGTRTGQIVPYHDWCNNEDISVYQNELITKRSSDGNVYSMTAGDWECYETFLKNR